MTSVAETPSAAAGSRFPLLATASLVSSLIMLASNIARESVRHAGLMAFSRGVSIAALIAAAAAAIAAALTFGLGHRKDTSPMPLPAKVHCAPIDRRSSL